MAHNKLTLLAAYNVIHKYYVICIPETYLDSPVQDNNLSINGYNLIRADHPNDVKQVGVCLYFKESVKLKYVNTPYFLQCLICTVTIKLNSEKLLSQIKHLKSPFTLVLAEFNTSSKLWWKIKSRMKDNKLNF